MNLLYHGRWLKQKYDNLYHYISLDLLLLYFLFPNKTYEK